MCNESAIADQTITQKRFPLFCCFCAVCIASITVLMARTVDLLFRIPNYISIKPFSPSTLFSNLTAHMLMDLRKVYLAPVAALDCCFGATLGISSGLWTFSVGNVFATEYRGQLFVRHPDFFGVAILIDVRCRLPDHRPVYRKECLNDDFILFRVSVWWYSRTFCLRYGYFVCIITELDISRDHHAERLIALFNATVAAL